MRYVLALALLGILASAEPCAALVLCANSGEAPAAQDMKLVERVTDWVSRLEVNIRLSPPVSKDTARRLQIKVSDWAGEPPTETVDYFFRQAVGHGVNVQYERLMIALNDGDVAQHTYFMHLEAARADACLSLLALR